MRKQKAFLKILGLLLYMIGCSLGLLAKSICYRLILQSRKFCGDLNLNFVIVITFYSPSCLGQETAKGRFGLRVKLPPAHLSTTQGGGFTLSLLNAERQAGKL